MSWKSSWLKAFAWMLRADPYEEIGGIETAFEREAPATLLDRISEEAADPDSSLEVSDLVTLASNEADPERLIEAALLGETNNELELLGEFLSDDDLSEAIGERDLWPDPIERVVRMPDDPYTCYAWVLSEDATDDDRLSLANEFEEGYIREHKREPQALHLIVRDVDQIKEFTAGEIKEHVKPWLRGALDIEDNNWGSNE